MEPTTAEDWMAVASDRAMDAEAIKQKQPNSVGSVYMAGYAIECSLKALLQKKGISTPTFGKKGHNLHELWQASGLHFSDLRDTEGKQTFFLQDWDTSLRYERNLPKSLGLEIPDLLAGAKQLNQWIQTQVRRSKPRR